MKNLLLAVSTCLSVVWGGIVPQMPAGKCRHPIPNMPGMNISKVQDINFYYVTAPNILIYKMADSVKMKIKKIDGEKGVFLQTINAMSIFKTQLNMQFKVKDLGNGVLKKITKEGEMSYYASIVSVKGNLALVYVCSDEAKDMGIDFTYTLAPEGFDPLSIDDPVALFKDVNDKFEFKGEQRELPQKLMQKVKI